jgi:hypothetical protein
MKPKLTPRERFLFAALIVVGLGSMVSLESVQVRGIARQIEAERPVKAEPCGQGVVK